MRTDFVRIYKSVHTWTGILTGLALFIAFYAGALTVFKEPLARWVAPPGETRAVTVDEAPQLIARTLAAQPGSARDFTVYLDDAEHLPGRLGWQVRNAGVDDHDESATRHFAATLAGDGSVEVRQYQPAELPAFIDTLHRVVGLPFDNDPSRWLMGVVAALYALALISGVVVLLPSLVKDFFALRVGKNRKRMWLDAHNLVGIVSLPFHLVMALTSVVFAFHDGIYDLQDKLIHGGQWSTAFQRSLPAVDAAPRDPGQMLAPRELVARARELAPGFRPEALQYQQVSGPRAVVRVWGKDPAAVSPRARGGFLALDPYSGRVVSRDFLPGQQSTANLFVSSFFALHMAAFGGTAVQWMYFLLGLAGAWLFYSGNLLWLETRRRKQAGKATEVPAQRRDARLMAAATVGVCLGCICGISLAIAGGKWLHVLAGIDAPRSLYYVAFFTCLGGAFAAGAARAAVPLLWLACALTLAIPLTSLLGVLLPDSGLWAHESLASLGVDATALAGAGALALLARATARRIAVAPADSVWSPGGGRVVAPASPAAQEAG